MKQCPKCNYVCGDDDVVCKNCGYLFSSENTAQTQGANPQSQQSGFNAQQQQPSFNSQPSFNAQPQPSFGTNNNQPETTDGKAIVSLIFGIIALVTSCCAVGGIFGIVSLILGIISKKNVPKTGASKTNGFAIAGIVLSIIAILIAIYMIISIAANKDTIMDILQHPEKYENYKYEYKYKFK